jgi:hypothetical protein
MKYRILGRHAESLHWHRRELMVAAATGPAVRQRLATL